MIRDFKRETIRELYDIIHTCEEETGNFNIIDYFKDYYSADLEISDYIDNIKAYHEYMFDKYNMNEQILDAILQRVDETERSYATQIAGYREMLEAFEVRVSKVCEMLQPQKLNMSIESYLKEMGQINAVYTIKKVNAANKVQGGANELFNIKVAEIEKIYGWLATDYKLTEEEVEEAAVILGRYFEPGTKQYNLKFTSDDDTSDIIRLHMTDAEYQEYQLMSALYNKCDSMTGFFAGFVREIPFIPVLVDSMEGYALELEGKTLLDVASFGMQYQNSYIQHPLATGTGRASMVLLEAYMIKECINEPVTFKDGTNVTNTVVENSTRLVESSTQLVENGIKSGLAISYAEMMLLQDVAINFSGNGSAALTSTEFVNNRIEGGSDTVAYHSVGGDNSAKKIQSVLDGIDISYTSPESRFGQGFYVAADGNTTVAELVYHGTDVKYSIRYDLNLEGQKVLDLTNPEVAGEWGFLQGESSLLECQNIAEIALDEGYNVIKVYSYRDDGINYVIYDNFDEILQPQMVTPIGD